MKFERKQQQKGENHGNAAIYMCKGLPGTQYDLPFHCEKYLTERKRYLEEKEKERSASEVSWALREARRAKFERLSRQKNGRR